MKYELTNTGVVGNAILRRYFQYLRMERSYTPNTLDAYLKDLQKLLNYYADEGIDFRSVTLEQLDRFAKTLQEVGIGPRSVARILSGVRSFYRFLTLEKEVETDPTELLESPKIGKHLPEVLSLPEIDAIEAAIDLSKPEGVRDLAIIEVLFSCGLRISELTGLKLSELYLEEGYIRVHGKGRKERLVPIGENAIEHLALRLYQGLRREGRHQEKHQPAHLPPQLRHAAPGGRCQPASHTGDARPRGHRHHRNLHAHRQEPPAAGNPGASSAKHQKPGVRFARHGLSPKNPDMILHVSGERNPMLHALISDTPR